MAVIGAAPLRTAEATVISSVTLYARNTNPTRYRRSWVREDSFSPAIS